MHIDRLERNYLIAVVITLALFFAALVAGAVIYGIRLPSTDGNSIVIPQNLRTLPGYDKPGLHPVTGSDNVYDMFIVALKWRFDVGGTEVGPCPDEVELTGTLQNPLVCLPKGSTVTFHVSSEDTLHGFMIHGHNLNIQLVPGHLGQQTIRFQEEGHFGMLCHEYCGISHQAMYADLIVYDPETATFTRSESEPVPSAEATAEATEAPEAEATAEAAAQA
jgi:cytochrome c oxidase subunit II